MDKQILAQLIKIERIITAYLSTTMSDEQKEKFLAKLKELDNPDPSASDGDVSVW
jgi:hypothetical protein